MRPHWPQILMNHGICQLPNDPDPSLSTSLERFEAQMRYLRRRNLRGVSARELRWVVSTGNARGLVGLTFDNGYEIFLHTALPVLEKFGFSATVFVVARMLDKEDSWNHSLNS